MLNNLSYNAFGVILSYLDYDTYKTLNKMEDYHEHLNNNQKIINNIIINGKLAKEWGKGILTLKSELKIDIPLNYSQSNLKQVILDLTEKILATKPFLKTKLFIEVYDLVSDCGKSSFQLYRNQTIRKRNEIIKKYYSDEEITEENEYLMRFLKMLKHLDGDSHCHTLADTLRFIQNPEELQNSFF